VVYKWYILPIGELYGTYHLLREPGNSIEFSKPNRLGFTGVKQYHYGRQPLEKEKHLPGTPNNQFLMVVSIG